MIIYKNKSVICLILGLFILGSASPVNVNASADNTSSKEVQTDILGTTISKKVSTSKRTLKTGISAPVAYNSRYQNPFAGNVNAVLKNSNEFGAMVQIRTKCIGVTATFTPYLENVAIMWHISEFPASILPKSPIFQKIFSEGVFKEDKDNKVKNTASIATVNISLGMGWTDRIKTRQPVSGKLNPIQIREIEALLLKEDNEKNSQEGFLSRYFPALFVNMEYVVWKNLSVGIQIVAPYIQSEQSFTVRNTFLYMSFFKFGTGLVI